MSPETKERKVGAVGPAEVGPASMVLAVCVNSEGAKVPDVIIGDPLTVELNTTPSPVIATEVTVPVPYGSDGISAATSARKVGVALEPVVGPPRNVFFTWEIRDSVTAPVEAALLYTTESPVIDVTPATVVGTYADTLLPNTWKVMLVFPPGAVGVVPLKLGLETVTPLTLTEEPPPTAASIKRKFSTTTSSAPQSDNPKFVEYCASPPG